MCARFYVLFMFASLSRIVNSQFSWPGSGDVNEGRLSIHLIRSTATKLYIQANCKPECLNITWECTERSYYMMHETFRKIKVKNEGYDTYAIQGLNSDAQYTVQARMGMSNSALSAHTCSEHVRDVIDLHSEKSGPGWLDIRWRVSSWTQCREDVEYMTRYSANGVNFTETRTYGAYPIDDKGTLHVGPSHPCPEWPKEFCLLITDNIYPGVNYTVEVRPRRIGGGEREVGLPRRCYAYADPYNKQGSDSGLHPECVPWAWVSVGACVFCITLIVGMLVSSVVGTIRKCNAYEKVHGPPQGPIDFMELLYS